MHKYYSILFTLLLLTACTTQNQAGVDGKKSAMKQTTATGAGSFALEIVPKKPNRSSSLSLIGTGFEQADASVTWIVNGRPFQTASVQQVRPGELRRGDTVQARAVVKGREIVSDQITIQNSAPQIEKVDVVVEALGSEASLRAEVVGQDIDDDQITYVYEWTNNGNPAGNGNRIDGKIKRGDTILVKIIPFDGNDYGKAVTVRREITNMRPVITAHQEFSFDGTVYAYQVKATDPDGDTLAYSLESPPDGITIDPSTGLLKWVVPKEFKGKKNVSMAVSDGNGGTAQYSFDMIIQ
jgi:hypothetical protein